MQDDSISFLQECFPFAEKEVLTFLFNENSLENCFKILLEEDVEVDQTREPLLIIQKKTKNEIIYRLETHDDLKRLEEMFPNYHQNAIENVYADCDGDYKQTARVLSEHMSSHSTNVAARDRNAINELRMLFPPDVVEERDLISAFYDSGFDIQVCVDKLLNALNPSSGKPVWQKFDAPTNFANPPKPIIDFRLVKSTTSYDTLTVNNSSIFTTQDPSSVRDQVSQLARERSQLFDQARSYFKQGSLTGRSAASFYAEKARGLTLKMNQLNNIASQSQIKLNSVDRDCNTLDLHGLRVSEAIAHIKEWGKAKSGWYKIITGAGNNSERGKAKLLPAVTSYVKSIGWKIDESRSGSGWIMVKVSG